MSRRGRSFIIDVVIDTNVFISALTGGRITARIYAALLTQACTPVFSPKLFDELLSTLARPAFELTPPDIERVALFLKLHARFIQPDQPVHACRDAKDNKLLECALAARPCCLVTGDKDLLVLHPFHGIPILSPHAFIERFL